MHSFFALTIKKKKIKKVKSDGVCVCVPFFASAQLFGTAIICES
jgi:hypothetical protein